MLNSPLCWDCRDEELFENGVYPGGIDPNEAEVRQFAWDYLRFRGLL
jgi:hypothetical protein